MKTFTNILLLAGLTAGVFNGAEAQRARNSNSPSRGGERREISGNVQRGGDRSFRPNSAQVRSIDRGNSGSRYNPSANIQRGERPVISNRSSNIRNNGQVRNEVARVDSRPNVDRGSRVPAGQYNRDRGNSRYNSGYNNSRYNNSRYNSSRYNNNYAYNSSRYGNRSYRTGYYGGRYNRGFSFAYGPRYSIIPRNHISIYFGGNPYYYYNGGYYGYYGGYYEPIFPPFGLRISFLPFGYTRLFVGAYPYYYYNGIYYRQYDNGDDYEVVDPPMGATVYSLPKGAKSVVLNGEKMYELNGTYYKEDRDSKGEVIYTVVGKNGEINNTEDDGAMENAVPPINNDVVAPPASLRMGDTVTQLPEGSKVVTINGEKMYVAPDDTYLKEESDGGTVQYKVVGVAK